LKERHTGIGCDDAGIPLRCALGVLELESAFELCRAPGKALNCNGIAGMADDKGAAIGRSLSVQTGWYHYEEQNPEDTQQNKSGHVSIGRRRAQRTLNRARVAGI